MAGMLIKTISGQKSEPDDNIKYLSKPKKEHHNYKPEENVT